VEFGVFDFGVLEVVVVFHVFPLAFRRDAKNNFVGMCVTLAWFVLIFPSLCKYFYEKVVFMLNLEEIKLRLVDANLKKVAEKAGIHEARVYRLMSGETEPMYETVKALSDYLEGRGTEQNREVV
jgi:hypothetical protein